MAIRLVAAMIIAFLMLPIIIMIPVSFGGSQYLEFPPSSLSMKWYRIILESPEWTEALWLSVRVSALSTIIATAIGVCAAFGLTRHKVHGKLLFYITILLPIIIPTIVTSVSIYFLFIELGLVGSAFGMAVGTAVTTVPIVVLIVSSTLQAFDVRLEHAAMSLGANPRRVFGLVTLPLIAPGVVSAALFAFLHSFGELLIPLFLSSPTNITLSVKIWTSIVMQIEPTIAAASVLLIGLAIAILGLAQLGQHILSANRKRVFSHGNVQHE